jgi:hypothetical protein
VTLTPEQRRIRKIQEDMRPRKFGKFGVKLEDAWLSEKLEAERAQKYVDAFSDLIAEKSGSLDEFLREQEKEGPDSDTQMSLFGSVADIQKRKRRKKEYEDEKQTNVWGLD